MNNRAQQPIPLELLHDFGGAGPVIHLAHGNGFPPETYTPLAQALAGSSSAGTEQTYHVIALPARPLWPNSQPGDAPDWHTLVEDLIQGLDGLKLRGIVGAGHSLGGACTLLAAVRRPDLFRAVALIDPVILPPGVLRALRILRWLGLSQRQPLVQNALRRRRLFPDRETCYAHYRDKPLFADWTEGSLRAYVEAGTRSRPDGLVELAYPPEWEAHIFATTPADIWRYVPQLRIPASLVCGEHTTTLPSASRRRIQRLLPRAQLEVIPDAGHTLPMERPEETAGALRGFLAGVANPPASRNGTTLH